MMLIKCVNTACTAPNGIFWWNPPIGYIEAQDGDLGAFYSVADCPYCKTKNKVLLKPDDRKPDPTTIPIVPSIPIIPMGRTEGFFSRGGMK